MRTEQEIRGAIKLLEEWQRLTPAPDVANSISGNLNWLRWASGDVDPAFDGLIERIGQRVRELRGET